MKPIAENWAAFAQHLHAEEASAHTLRSYVSDLNDFARWFVTHTGEPFAAAQVTPGDVRAYRQALLHTAQRAPATVNRHLASLRAYFRWAVGQGAVSASPLDKVQAVAEVRAGPRGLSLADTRALQRALEKAGQASGTRRALWQRRDAAVLTLLGHTGLRVAEAVALDVGHVVLRERSGQITVQGKGSKVRTVPLNAEARQALKGWLSERPICDTPALFVSQALRRLTARSIERVAQNMGEQARLSEPLTPHRLRHTFAKALVDRGVPLTEVADLLGHANLNTTRIYTTPTPQDLAQAVEQLSQIDDGHP